MGIEAFATKACCVVHLFTNATQNHGIKLFNLTFKM